MGYVIQACMVCGILAVVAICVNAERSVKKELAEEARQARERYEAAVESGDFEPIMEVSEVVDALTGNITKRYLIDENASFQRFVAEENVRAATGIDFGGYNPDPNLNPSHGNDFSQPDYSQPAQTFDSCGGYDAGGGFNSFGF